MNNITTKNENNIINFYNNNNPISPWNDIPLKIPIKQYYSDFGNPWNESLLNKEYLYNFIYIKLGISLTLRIVCFFLILLFLIIYLSK